MKGIDIVPVNICAKLQMSYINSVQEVVLWKNFYPVIRLYLIIKAKNIDKKFVIYTINLPCPYFSFLFHISCFSNLKHVNHYDRYIPIDVTHTSLVSIGNRSKDMFFFFIILVLTQMLHRVSPFLKYFSGTAVL